MFFAFLYNSSYPFFLFGHNGCPSKGGTVIASVKCIDVWPVAMSWGLESTASDNLESVWLGQSWWRISSIMLESDNHRWMILGSLLLLSNVSETERLTDSDFGNRPFSSVFCMLLKTRDGKVYIIPLNNNARVLDPYTAESCINVNHACRQNPVIT
jgi:hypothetical protein